MSASNMVQTISDEFSRFFRHVLPGAVILGALYKSQPSFFREVSLDKNSHCVILLVGALALGNLWYIVHRYTLHQVLDWFCYMVCERKRAGYLEWLYNHVHDSFTLPSEAKKLQEHLHFRSAQVIFLFITGEVLILFAIWHESESVFDANSCVCLCVGILIFLSATIQYWISNRLDVFVVSKFSKK